MIPGYTNSFPGFFHSHNFSAKATWSRYFQNVHTSAEEKPPPPTVYKITYTSPISVEVENDFIWRVTTIGIYWRDPFFTSMIMGGRLIILQLIALKVHIAF